MKGSVVLPLFTLLVSFTTPLASGLKIPFKRNPEAPKATFGVLTAHGEGGQTGNLGNVDDRRYTATLKLNGHDVVLALDTGSSDLWAYYPEGLGQFNDTQIPGEVLYGDGSYGVKGTIGVAPVEFGPYKVENQAFLDVREFSVKGLIEVGIHGLLGLGFNGSRASVIDGAIRKKYGQDATWGQPWLQNIFAQNTSTRNFIAIDLARTDDLEDIIGGSFEIGEYDSRYSAVENAPKLNVFPKGVDFWQTILDEIKIDGKSIPISSSVQGAPQGKAIAVLDTGAPTSLFTKKVVNAIYGSVPGAVYEPNYFGWILPCNATPQTEFIFGGQSFPMHPLDLSMPEEVTVKGQKYTACLGNFHTADGWSDTWDFLLGDAFLRNTYTVYDFGDYNPDTFVPGEPYMQLLAETNVTGAAAEALEIRARTLAGKAPEIAPSELLKLVQGAQGGSNPQEGETAINAPDLSNLDWDDVKKYAFIGIGLLAANVVIGLALLVLGVAGCIRKRGKPVDSAGKPQYVPIGKTTEPGPNTYYSGGRYDTPYHDS